MIQFNLSLTGNGHVKRYKACQDASRIEKLAGGWYLAVIADGVGSASKAEVGANTVVEAIIHYCKEKFPSYYRKKALLRVLQDAFRYAVKKIEERSKSERVSVEEYDTTLSCVLYNGRNIIYGHSGDGGIIALRESGEYVLLTKQQKGNDGISVIPLWNGETIWDFGIVEGPFCSVLLATDGLYETLFAPSLLKLQNQRLHIPILESFMNIDKVRRELGTCSEHVGNKVRQLFTQSEELKNVTDDDKTMAVLINDSVTPRRMQEAYYKAPCMEKLMQKREEMLYPNRTPLLPDNGMKVGKQEGTRSQDVGYEMESPARSDGAKITEPQREKKNSSEQFSAKNSEDAKETGQTGRMSGKEESEKPERPESNNVCRIMIAGDWGLLAMRLKAILKEKGFSAFFLEQDNRDYSNVRHVFYLISLQPENSRKKIWEKIRKYKMFVRTICERCQVILVIYGGNVGFLPFLFYEAARKCCYPEIFWNYGHWGDRNLIADYFDCESKELKERRKFGSRKEGWVYADDAAKELVEILEDCPGKTMPAYEANIYRVKRKKLVSLIWQLREEKKTPKEIKYDDPEFIERLYDIFLSHQRISLLYLEKKRNQYFYMNDELGKWAIRSGREIKPLEQMKENFSERTWLLFIGDREIKILGKETEITFCEDGRSVLFIELPENTKIEILNPRSDQTLIVIVLSRVFYGL